MKKFISLFLLLIFLSVSAQVRWMTFEQALIAQKENPKKIFIDFYADWCAPCKIMDKETYGNDIIAAHINENYYAVKFNAEDKNNVAFAGRTFSNPQYRSDKKRNTMHELTKYMNVNSVPSIVFLDENANPITILQGALTAKELEPYIPFIANDEYKKIVTREQWENYQKKFKSKIKG